MKPDGTQSTATSLTMLRQALAFLIDMALITFPVFIHVSLETLAWAGALWLLYIPMAEYFFGRTLGMAAVGTRILGLDGGRVPASAVVRRFVARFSMVWGIVGWLTLLTHFRIAEGYIILRKGESIADLKIANDDA